MMLYTTHCPIYMWMAHLFKTIQLVSTEHVVNNRDTVRVKDIFCWWNNMQCFGGSEKMRNASRHHGENEQQ